jgi:hypothetical protein
MVGWRTAAVCGAILLEIEDGAFVYSAGLFNASLEVVRFETVSFSEFCDILNICLIVSGGFSRGDFPVFFLQLYEFALIEVVLLVSAVLTSFSVSEDGREVVRFIWKEHQLLLAAAVGAFLKDVWITMVCLALAMTSGYDVAFDCKRFLFLIPYAKGAYAIHK